MIAPAERIHLNNHFSFGKAAFNEHPAFPKTKVIHLIGITVLIGIVLTTASVLIASGIGAVIAASVSSSMILALGISACVGGGIGLAATSGLFAFMASRKRKKTPHNQPLPPKDASIPLGTFSKTEAILSKDAKESAEWKLNLLKSAKQSIELSGNFCGGAIFRKALYVIKETMEKNPELKTHIIASQECLLKEDYKLLKSLSKQFPDRFFFLETKQNIITHPIFASSENHVKMLVIDQEYSMVGGTGLQDVLCGHSGENKPPKNPNAPWKDRVMAPTRDMDIITKGPSSKTLRVEFYNLWSLWCHQMKEKSLSKQQFFDVDSSQAVPCDKWKENEKTIHAADVSQLVCDPVHHTNQITNGLVKLIKEAKKTVVIANLCFNPTEEVLDAMIDAASRGVDITVLTNASDKESPFSNRFWAKAAHQNYLPLMAGRKITKLNRNELAQSAKETPVKIYEYAVPGILYHSKVAIVDDKYTMIGSYNLTKKSHRLDHELVQVLDSPQIAKEAVSIIKGDIENRSREVSFDTAFKNYKGTFSKIQKGFISNFYV